MFENHSNQPDSICNSIIQRFVGVIFQLVYCGANILIGWLLVQDVVLAHYEVHSSLFSTLLLSILFGTPFLLQLFNFALASFVCPGVTMSYQELKVDMSQPINPNVCGKCERVKPERAHHCAVCRRCVLRMDHHCPWINNCVGHRNTRYFLLFLVYETAFLALATCGFTWVKLNDDFQEYEMVFPVFLAQAPMACFAFFLVILVFTVSNWRLAISGRTSIEFWNERIPDPADLGKQATFSHETIQENLYEIFAHSQPIRILLPSFKRLPEDGIRWKKAHSYLSALPNNVVESVAEEIHSSDFKSTLEQSEYKQV